jgi:branched-chain amino acid transport system substrate-binding protein
MVHMGVYSGVHHFLSAARAAGTPDSENAAKKMHERRVNNIYNKDVVIREDGHALMRCT